MRSVLYLSLTPVIALMLASCGRGSNGTAGGEGAAAPGAGTEASAAPLKIVGWRGDGSGRYEEADPVLEWSEEKNILWRVEVGESFSTPVASGGRVYVTAEDDKLLCVDAASGKVLWSKENGFASLPAEMKAEEKGHSTDCGFSSPSPVTDGRLVYACYGTGIVVCYDPGGDRKWVRHFAYPQATEYGRSASPVLAGGKLLVSIGHLIALDPQSGETLWEAKTAEANYGTPAVAKIVDIHVAVTPDGKCVRMSDGKVLAKGISSANYTTPLVDGDVVYFLDAYTMAVRLLPDAAGGVKAEDLWDVETEGEFFSSPVLHDGILYGACNEGALYAVDVKKGELLYRKELAIPSAGGRPGVDAANIYPSVTSAGKHLFLGNDMGYVLVLSPGKEYREVATNTLDEGCGATPVFSGRRIFLRSGEALLCVAAE